MTVNDLKAEVTMVSSVEVGVLSKSNKRQQRYVVVALLLLLISTFGAFRTIVETRL